MESQVRINTREVSGDQLLRGKYFVLIYSGILSKMNVARSVTSAISRWEEITVAHGDNCTIALVEVGKTLNLKIKISNKFYVGSDQPDVRAFSPGWRDEYPRVEAAMKGDPDVYNHSQPSQPSDNQKPAVLSAWDSVTSKILAKEKGIYWYIDPARTIDLCRIEELVGAGDPKSILRIQPATGTRTLVEQIRDRCDHQEWTGPNLLISIPQHLNEYMPDVQDCLNTFENHNWNGTIIVVSRQPPKYEKVPQQANWKIIRVNNEGNLDGNLRIADLPLSESHRVSTSYGGTADSHSEPNKYSIDSGYSNTNAQIDQSATSQQSELLPPPPPPDPTVQNQVDSAGGEELIYMPPPIEHTSSPQLHGQDVSDSNITSPSACLTQSDKRTTIHYPREPSSKDYCPLDDNTTQQTCQALIASKQGKHCGSKAKLQVAGLPICNKHKSYNPWCAAPGCNELSTCCSTHSLRTCAAHRTFPTCPQVKQDGQICRRPAKVLLGDRYCCLMHMDSIPEYCKQQSSPESLRYRVWRNYHSGFQGYCGACLTEIDYDNYYCTRMVSGTREGLDEIELHIPLCHNCNSSLETQLANDRMNISPFID